MKKNMKWAVLLCLALAMAAGCAKSGSVPLIYTDQGPYASCSGDIVIFKFLDKRENKVLGKYSDGSPITADNDVADWIGWALFEELENGGCKPKYRTSTTPAGDGLLVTGEVLSVKLNQTGTTTYAGEIAVRIVVSRNGEAVHAQKYYSQVENVVVPGYSSESDIMAEALRGIMSEAIPVIAAMGSGPM